MDITGWLEQPVSLPAWLEADRMCLNEYHASTARKNEGNKWREGCKAGFGNIPRNKG